MAWRGIAAPKTMQSTKHVMPTRKATAEKKSGHDDSRERRRKREGIDVDARRDEGRAVAHAAGDEEDDERNDGEQKCRRGKPQPREEQDFVLFDFAVRMLLPHIDSLLHNSKFVNSVADARQE